MKKIEGADVLFNPLNHVLRGDVPLHSISGPVQILASRLEVLDEILTSESVLFATYQETGSRSKRVVLIEKLGEALFGVLPVSAAFLPPRTIEQMPTYVVKSSIAHPWIQMDRNSWWQDVVHNLDDPYLATVPNSVLEFAHQPNTDQTQSADCSLTLDGAAHLMRRAYYETLYESKAPLAYFAKTTLPRLRTSIKDRVSPETNFDHYIFSHLIPNLADLDVKYKVHIPRFADSTSRGISDDSGNLAPFEESYIRNWLVQCAQGTESISPDVAVSRCLMPLKLREYQLIILLLLECLLVKSHLDSFKKGDVLPSANTANLQSPELLIDILTDRISIGQSLDFTCTNDILKDFCVEVIRPFYSVKLPTITQALYRKCVPEAHYHLDNPRTPSILDEIGEKIRSKTVAKAATLQRSRSAPEKLLSERKLVVKRKTLGKEISMTKRVPKVEPKRDKLPMTTRESSFEQRRKSRIDWEETQRIQVGQTPAKPRAQILSIDSPLVTIPELQINRESKASFMSICETPTRSKTSVNHEFLKSFRNNDQTSVGSIRGLDNYARMEGIQESPSRVRTRTKVDSPSTIGCQRKRNMHMGAELSMNVDTDANLPSAVRLYTSGTFAGHTTKNAGALLETIIDDERPANMAPTFRAEEKEFDAFFPETQSVDAGTESFHEGRRTLKDELDWL